MPATSVIILAIESSCDETSAAVLKDGKILANIVASQEIHTKFGGVVPELASRVHQQNIVPVVDAALKESGITKEELSAIAFTQGPGLIGALLVGTSFAKAMAMSLNIPLIAVQHMQAHVLAHFIDSGKKVPDFPFLCLTVSGGHTQLVLVKKHLEMEIIGQTIDDAAGEAFDKSAKMLGLPYPGGPLIDKYAQLGNPDAFKFPVSNIAGYDYSFSGLKTSILYFLQKQVAANPNFIEEHLNDICASIQKTIIETLLLKLKKACTDLNINQIAIAGGVSANKGLRNALTQLKINGKTPELFIPEFEYCTDNAAMIAITAYYKFLKQYFADQSFTPNARLGF